MIAGKGRFYLVAGIAGAIAGEAVAAAVALALTGLALAHGLLLRRDVAVTLASILVVLGIALGAWAGVALLRRSVRRAGARPPPRRACARVTGTGSDPST